MAEESEHLNVLWMLKLLMRVGETRNYMNACFSYIFYGGMFL